MATTTPDPRKPFLSTRYNTNRFPGFYTRTLSDTGNVEEEKPQTTAVSPLRGVGIGSATESDGPGTEPVGKQYADMTDEELDQEQANRSLATSLFGVGMPDDLEGYGKKALGLATNMGFPGFGPAVNMVNRASQKDFDRAVENRAVREIERSIASGGPSPQSDYERDVETGMPDARGHNTPQPDYSFADSGGDPNTGYGVGDPNAGTTTDTDDSGRGAQGPSEADSGSSNESDGPGSDSGTGGPGAGEDSSGAEGGPGSWRRGGPIPNRGSPAIEPVQITAHEGEFVFSPEATRFWGQDVMDALQAVGDDTATDEQFQLLLNAVRRGVAEAAPQERPNPMQGPMGSPLRSAGRGYLQ